MLHKEFWGLLFLAFVGWIFISANQTERLERVCRPIGWGGNVVVSVSALIVPDQQKTVQGWFDKLEYGCRYATWRLLYQSDWNKAQQGHSAEKVEQAAAVETKALPAGSPSSAAAK